MVKIRANISLFKNGRKTPFCSGYRPLFEFVKSSKTSGKIELIDREYFSPGDQGFVTILFLSKEYLGENFGVGTKFTFGEGREPIGEGIVVSINDRS